MTDAPERIWAQDTDPNECNYIGGGWWDDEQSQNDYPHILEYTRADISQALVAAAYEDAACEVITEWNNPDAPDDGICEHLNQAVLALIDEPARTALDAMIEAAVMEEREACAVMADDHVPINGRPLASRTTAVNIAQAIRNRGKDV